VVRDGRCEQIHVPVGPPLGVHLCEFTEHRVAMPPGATLVAFTDGLVERRKESIQARIERLCQLLASPSVTTAEAAVARALDVTEGEGHEDDIAVIAIRMQTDPSHEGVEGASTVDRGRPGTGDLVGAGEAS
jgi:hypothetical protein